MSADNYIGIFKLAEDKYVVGMAFMSDNYTRNDIEHFIAAGTMKVFKTKAEAEEAAQKQYSAEDYVEYGVQLGEMVEEDQNTN